MVVGREPIVWSQTHYPARGGEAPADDQVVEERFDVSRTQFGGMLPSAMC